MTKAQTVLRFIGGVNKDRIGGNCSVVEHTDEQGQTSRVMFDLGSMFTPFESGFVAAYPNVDEYFDRLDPQTGDFYKALKPVDALYITHAHEDHIGALVNYVKMGYILPPMKASGFTRNFIRLAFKKEGLPIPEIEKLKAGDNKLINDNMMIEAVDVSHSIIDSLGFHVLTFVNDKPYAAVMNNGDFLTEEEMPVGHSFNKEAYLDVFRRKQAPLSVLCLDSTSTLPQGKDRIGFEKAVQNTLEVINRAPDRSLIVSPVISRSVQNMAIDIEVARALNTKIALDGKWLQTVKEAMDLSGYKDFDDVIYKGTLKGYMNDKSISKKYIVCTGAFAQGLENYEFNRGIDDTTPIPLASATKMALDLHPYVHVNKNMLVLARQRIIDEINGRTGPKMLQMLAAQGAKVVMSPYRRNIGGFEQVPMQDSGHVNAKALTELLESMKDVASNMVVVPIHGNPEQCENTKTLSETAGVKCFMARNLENLEIGNGKVSLIAPKATPVTWLAVKSVMPGIQDERDIPPAGISEYWEVTEDYQPIRKITEVENIVATKFVDDMKFKHKFEDEENLPRFEKMHKRRLIRSNAKGRHDNYGHGR